MPFSKTGSALPAVFNTRDEAMHKQLKNPIAPMFSLSNTITHENFVNQVLQVLFHQLDRRFVDSHTTFDLGNWLQYFAFDVMGTLTFSKRYGFLEKGQDVNGMLETIWNYMTDAAPFTQIPWLDDLWRKNRLVATLRGSTGFSILQVVSDFIGERQQKVHANEKGEGKVPPQDRDMLSRFLEIAQTNESVPPWSDKLAFLSSRSFPVMTPSLTISRYLRAPTAWTFSNIIAGSDSTGVVLKTTMYNLLAHPSTVQRLYEELLTAERTQHLTRPFPTWTEVCDLPYLDACINEGVRLHPPFCLPFERVVPDGGITVCGHFFSGGTVVGMSPWVVNRHRPTFGEDADRWRPERWLAQGAEHRKKLDSSVLTVRHRPDSPVCCNIRCRAANAETP